MQHDAVEMRFLTDRCICMPSHLLAPPPMPPPLVQHLTDRCMCTTPSSLHRRSTSLGDNRGEDAVEVSWGSKITPRLLPNALLQCPLCTPLPFLVPPLYP